MGDRSYSTDELVSPKWMDEQFFQMALQKSKKESDIFVDEIVVNPATKSGDHYSSIMYRVRVNYTQLSKKHSKSLIVKTMPFIDGIKKDMLKNSRIFDIEMKFYGESMPAMERLLRSIGDNTQLGGKMVYCSNEPCPIIILEDLCELNYVMQRGPIGFTGTKMVYEKLGRWHATTLYLAEVEKMDFSFYNVNLFNGSMGDELKEFMYECLNIILETLQDWECFEKYEANLKTFIKNFDQNGIETFAPNAPNHGYNVLNHGDLHAKNLMVKYKENGDIDDILLIDYQLSCYGSPSLDLGYSMFSLADENVRINHRDEIIYIYHQEFTKTLAKLNYPGKIPTMTDLQIEIARKGFVEVYTGLAFMPFKFVDFSKIDPELKVSGFGSKGKKMRIQAFQQPLVKQLLKKYFLQFIRKGYL